MQHSFHHGKITLTLHTQAATRITDLGSDGSSRYVIVREVIFKVDNIRHTTGSKHLVLLRQLGSKQNPMDILGCRKVTEMSFETYDKQNNDINNNVYYNITVMIPTISIINNNIWY